MRGLKTVKGDGRWAWYLAEDSMSYDHQTEGGGLKELSLSHVQLFLPVTWAYHWSLS